MVETAQPADVQAPQETTVSLDEMIASLDGEAGAASEGSEAAPESEPSAENVAPADVDEEEAEEVAEATSEAKPEAKADGKKTSRNQRLKAARDAAIAEVYAEKKNVVKATSVANYWRNEAQAQQNLLRHVLEQTGFRLDQRDLQLLDVRREEMRRGLEAQAQESTRSVDQERDTHLQRRSVADQFVVQADKLSRAHGVPPEKILQAYALAEAQGFGTSMDEVAASLGAVSKPRGSAGAPSSAQRAPAAGTNPAKLQLIANRSAPISVRSGRAPLPDFDSSTEGMMAFLDSRPKTTRK